MQILSDTIGAKQARRTLTSSSFEVGMPDLDRSLAYHPESFVEILRKESTLGKNR
jgi:hypothetical protein